MIRADCLQDDQKQFVPLFFPFLRESSIKTSVKAILTDNHCFPFACCWECVTLTRLIQKADWRRLCFTLSKSLCLRALHLTSVAKVEIIIDQKPTHSKYKGKPANTGDIRKFVWTDRNGGRSTSGEMTSVRSSGECEFLAELSLFASQKSGEATLYKWAKFLSIWNIILTSQQCEQILQWTNENPNTDRWQSNVSAQVDTP